MLLTEQEIDDLSREMVKGCKSVNWLAKKIESAVLEKLKAQTPVGSVYRNVVTGDFELLAYDDANHPKGTYSDIYTDPIPPDDVVRVAELEAVLRECREALVKNIVGTGGRTPAAHDAIAKIDEVLPKTLG